MFDAESFSFPSQTIDSHTVSELFQRVITGYSKVYNAKYDRVGALFQDQFKAVRVESDEQMQWLSAYIHQNPRVAGLVENLDDWPWSSYLDFVGGRNGRLINSQPVLGLQTIQYSVERYKAFVDSAYGSIKSRKDIELLLLD